MFGQYIWLFPWRNETVKPLIVFVLADTYQSHLKFSDINTCIFITIGSGSFEWAWWLCMYWHGQVESTVLICIIKLLLSWNNIWKMINTETRKPCNIDYEITYRYNYEKTLQFSKLTMFSDKKKSCSITHQFKVAVNWFILSWLFSKFECTTYKYNR